MADAWSGNATASAALADRAVALLEARLAAPKGKEPFCHFGYAETCRLIERMGALRARRRETAAHAAFVAEMLTRHKAKRNFVAMLRPMLAAA